MKATELVFSTVVPIHTVHVIVAVSNLGIDMPACSWTAPPASGDPPA